MQTDNDDPPPLRSFPPQCVTAPDGELRIRRAEPADLSVLVDLFGHAAVEPFLAAVSPSTPEELATEIRRSVEQPSYHGRLLVEVREAEWVPVGSIAYEVANRRSRIAYLSALAISPERRGRGLGSLAARLTTEYLVHEVGYHRVQCEIYEFNERAVALAVRAGFTKEGVRRRAYWRRGAWVDGVLFGALADEAMPRP